MASNVFPQIETSLFDSFIKRTRKEEGGPIFILGAPRTGSTLCYQALIAAFRLPYITNLTNEYFATTPIVGLAIQAGCPCHDELMFVSEFGKAQGLFQPSEGSAVMSHWFGGGHPSQVVSKQILVDSRKHFGKTLQASMGLFGKPLVIKNAWNCFRIANLAEMLPRAWFIWARRDISDSAKSDLHARYVTKGSPEVWNSATPWNVDALRQRPYVEQVVENQYEFNVAIENGLAQHAAGWVEIWYEDFCAEPAQVIGTLHSQCSPLTKLECTIPTALTPKKPRQQWDIPDKDAVSIDNYIDQNATRFAKFHHPNHASRLSEEKLQLPVRL